MGRPSLQIRESPTRRLRTRDQLNPGKASLNNRAASQAGEPRARSLGDLSATGLLVVITLGLVGCLGFFAGGFFPGPAAAAAALVLLALAAIVVFDDRVLGRITRGLALAAISLGLYCAWILVSTAWSGTPGRSLVEFDRAVLYLGVLLVGGAIGAPGNRPRWLLRSLLAGALVVCLAGLLSRALPDVVTAAQNVSNSRLSFPLTYWNDLGLLATLGMVFAVAIAADRSERMVLRAIAAGSTPVLAATLMLTFARGPIGAGAVALLGLIVVGRGAGMVTAVLAVLPTSALALVVAYQADQLAQPDPTTAGAIEQGHDLVIAVAAACVVAVLILAVVHRAEPAFRWPIGRRSSWAIAIATGLIAVVALVASGAPGFVADAYDEFVHNTPADLHEQRDRLTNFGNHGRLELWRVAIDEGGDHPLNGSGAGTYELGWERTRELDLDVTDAHSLPLENMAELGVVGLGLLAVCLAAIFVGLARRIEGPQRLVFAGLFFGAVAWLIEACIDWSWEMPTVSAWLFLAGGAALARAGSTEAFPGWAAGARTRVLAALAILVVAAVPAQVFVSQRQLDDSVAAFNRGDCVGAVDSALSSLSAINVRSEAYAVLGYCDVRLRAARLGVQMMSEASAHDPDNWEYAYGLGLVQAAAGIDPTAELRRAARLNPIEELPRLALRRLQDRSPGARAQIALGLPLPRPGR